jgi:hypothetical protein
VENLPPGHSEQLTELLTYVPSGHFSKHMLEPSNENSRPSHLAHVSEPESDKYPGSQGKLRKDVLLMEKGNKNN